MVLIFVLISCSASSTAEPPIWQIRSSNTNNQANSTQNQGKEYSRVEPTNHPDTVFSSSGMLNVTQGLNISLNKCRNFF